MNALCGLGTLTVAFIVASTYINNIDLFKNIIYKLETGKAMDKGHMTLLLSSSAIESFAQTLRIGYGFSFWSPC